MVACCQWPQGWETISWMKGWGREDELFRSLWDEWRLGRLGNFRQTSVPGAQGYEKGWCGKRMLRLKRSLKNSSGTLDFILQAVVDHWRTRVGQCCCIEFLSGNREEDELGVSYRKISLNSLHPDLEFNAIFASWTLHFSFSPDDKFIQRRHPVFPSAQLKFSAKVPEGFSSDLSLSLLWSDVTITLFLRSVISTGLLYLFYCTFLGMSRKWSDVKCKGHRAVGSGSEMESRASQAWMCTRTLEEHSC